MRIILFILVAILLFSTCWFKRQQESAQKQLAVVEDTLAYLQLNYPYVGNNWDITGLDSIIGPKYLALGDSLQEMHRIIWRIRTAYAFIIKQKKDRTVWLEYKHFTVKNPLTGEGHTALLLAKTMAVPTETFDQFRQKLSAISFLDATRHEDYICCYTTGSLNWEAKFQNKDYLKHYTVCRQSVQFAEACETMMRLVDDPDLQQALGYGK